MATVSELYDLYLSKFGAQATKDLKPTQFLKFCKNNSLNLNWKDAKTFLESQPPIEIDESSNKNGSENRNNSYIQTMTKEYEAKIQAIKEEYEQMIIAAKESIESKFKTELQQLRSAIISKNCKINDLTIALENKNNSNEANNYKSKYTNIMSLLQKNNVQLLMNKKGEICNLKLPEPTPPPTVEKVSKHVSQNKSIEIGKLLPGVNDDGIDGIDDTDEQKAELILLDDEGEDIKSICSDTINDVLDDIEKDASNSEILKFKKWLKDDVDLFKYYSNFKEAKFDKLNDSVFELNHAKLKDLIKINNKNDRIKLLKEINKYGTKIGYFKSKKGNVVDNIIDKSNDNCDKIIDKFKKKTNKSHSLSLTESGSNSKKNKVKKRNKNSQPKSVKDKNKGKRKHANTLSDLSAKTVRAKSISNVKRGRKREKNTQKKGPKKPAISRSRSNVTKNR